MQVYDFISATKSCVSETTYKHRALYQSIRKSQVVEVSVRSEFKGEVRVDSEF